MLCRNTVLNTRRIRIQTSIDRGLLEMTAATSGYGNSPEQTSSYLSEKKVKVVVLLVPPHF